MTKDRLAVRRGRPLCGRRTLKGWTLPLYDAVRVKWFAWAAEHPETSNDFAGRASPTHRRRAERGHQGGRRDSAESAGRPKKFATLQAVDAKRGTVTLIIDGEKEARAWPLTPDAEVKSPAGGAGLSN